MKRVVLLWCVGLLGFGCGESSTDETGATATDAGSGNETSDDDDDAAGTSGAATSGSSETDDSGASDSESDTNDDPTTGPNPEDLPPPPATGIQIIHVTADQAVRTTIARDGQLVDGNLRSVPLLQDRAAVIRAFYALEPGFEPRDIYAVLTVSQADGTTTTHDNFVTAIEKECEGEDILDCRYGTLPNTFFWRLPPEEVQPGAEYKIEMFETTPGFEDNATAAIPYFPTDGGTLAIGVEDSYMKMRVVLVPIDHDIGADCPAPPEITEDFGPSIDGEMMTVADFFGERLKAQNPVDEVEIIAHEPVRFTGSLTGGALLGALQQLRFQENAPPEYFYYAVARPCDDGPDFAGLAQIGGPSPGSESQRVGWGVYYSSPGTTAETFVHEIGHEQGRHHIACSGEEAGTDPSYPHPEGDLTNYGVDVYNTSLKVHEPSDHDYMTYCGSTFVSQWGYEKVMPWIAEMSSWEFGAAPPKQDILVGNLRADGSQEWYVTRGYLPEAQLSEQTTVRFGGSTRGTTELAAARFKWERSEDLNIIAPLPEDFAQVRELVWVDHGQELRIDRDAISTVHVATDFTIGL